MTAFRQPFKGEYKISLDFGEAFPPLYTYESPHKGIDYELPMRTPVLASDDGFVSLLDNLTVGFGKYVMLTHNRGNYQTIYAHLDDILVKKFQQVSKGDVIGYSGTSGNSTGPHLHFELRKNGIAIDPRPLMQSVLDDDGYNNSTPSTEKPKFEPVHDGFCIVCCDVANVRCHCDMTRVIGHRKRGDIITVSDVVTMYNGLPYRDYYDPTYQCWLRIAEHDPDVQMIRNYSGEV